MPLHARKEDFHITSEEEKRRRESLEYVVNSMKLEGIILDKETLEDFELYARGELTENELIKRGLKLSGPPDKKI
jgi:hypothetical protein